MKQFFLATLFLFQLTGCSSTKFIYENADWYLAREYNKLLDLSGDRKDQLRGKVDEYFEIHRRDVLPQYAHFASELAQKAETENWTLTEAQWVLERLDEIGELTTKPTISIIAHFLLSMSPEEIKVYEKNFKSEQAEYVELIKDRTEAQRIARGVKALLRFLKFVAGSQKEAQEEVALEYLKKWPNSANMEWALYHERMSLGLIDLLKQSPSKEKLKSYLYNWYVEPEKSRRRSHQLVVKNWRANTIIFIRDWFNSMDSKQREELLKRLKKMQRDFLDLSQDS